MKVTINRKVMTGIVIFLIVLILGGFLYAVLSQRQNKHDNREPSAYNTPSDGRIYLDGNAYVPNRNLDVILLIGLDKFDEQITENEGYNNQQQSDFLMLLLVDKSAETVRELQINRDTIADIPVLGVRGENAGTVRAQLALAHTYGKGERDSSRNVVEAVSNLLYGVHIDHYITLTMDAVAQFNDIVGGVTVEVLQDMTSIDPELEKGKMVHLEGDQALTYVRARTGLEDSTNISRMERQRQYINAVRDAISEDMMDDADFLLDALNKISPYMLSDLTSSQLSKLYERWDTYEDKGFVIIEGESKKGDKYMEFIPDEEKLRELVTDLFYIPVEE